MKLKSLILTFTLTLFAVSGLLAQDKYEFATVHNYGDALIVFTTSENQESTPTKGKEANKDILKKINELSEKGWEVYDTDHGVYYLRKKKNQ
jgi:hypothetical protein